MVFGGSPFGSTPYGSGPVHVRTTAIDSSRWTGLPTEYKLTEARREHLQSLIEKAMSDLELLGAGNAEKAQARSYLVALNALSEAPEPPSDVIWSLLERGMVIVGVCELFYRIADALLI